LIFGEIEQSRLRGLSNNALIRMGKELGVDEYITKPFCDETLISTINGKIKRARQF
jgi:DNA-binding response OmpR family regulator